jgi:hypothetical protein
MKTPAKDMRSVGTADAFLERLRAQAGDERTHSQAIGPLGWIAILSPVIAVVTGASIAFAS